MTMAITIISEKYGLQAAADELRLNGFIREYFLKFHILIVGGNEEALIRLRFAIVDWDPLLKDSQLSAIIFVPSNHFKFRRANDPTYITYGAVIVNSDIDDFPTYIISKFLLKRIQHDSSLDNSFTDANVQSAALFRQLGFLGATDDPEGLAATENTAVQMALTWRAHSEKLFLDPEVEQDAGAQKYMVYVAKLYTSHVNGHAKLRIFRPKGIPMGPTLPPSFLDVLIPEGALSAKGELSYETIRQIYRQTFGPYMNNFSRPNPIKKHIADSSRPNSVGFPVSEKILRTAS
jgi:hypothetical protein